LTLTPSELFDCCNCLTNHLKFLQHCLLLSYAVHHSPKRIQKLFFIKLRA
jgi:hypothetical protein